MIKKKRTVAGDLTLTLSTVLALVMTFLGLLFYLYIVIVLREQHRENSKRMIEEMARMLSSAVWDVDHDYIIVFSNGYVSSENIDAIKVFVDKDIIVNTFPKEQTDTLHMTTVIKHENKEIGTVEVLFSKKAEKKMIELLLFLISSTILITIVIVVLSTRIIIGRILIKPIKKLIQTFNTVATGDYTSKISTNVKQIELAKLVSKINQTIDRISERENDLQLLKNYMKNTIDSMPSIIVGVDESGNIVQWNLAAEKITNINSSDAAGQNAYNLLSWLLKDELVINNALNGNTIESISNISVNKNGQHLFYDLTVFPLTEEHFKGAVIRIDDVTKSTKQEEQFRQSQKMETIGTLAGGLAHDFNNVLGGIMGTLSILKFKSKKGRLTEDQMKGYLETIEKSGNRAKAMVQQLLALSRKQDLVLVPVDLNTSIKHVMEIAENSFDKTVKLAPVYNKFVAMINADPVQIEQVILNFAVNAAHAMTIMRDKNENPGGTLSITLDNFNVDSFFIQSHPEFKIGMYWKMSISDTGIGIPKSIISNIFNPFFTTKDKGVGTGLGLSMVYNIIKQHHGFVDLYSEVGVGSTFNIFLPIIEPDTVEQIENKQEYIIPKGEGIILVVDDELIMRDMASEMLGASGYNVITANNGIEGVEIFRKRYSEIKLVILDMAMPEISGKETYIRMKEIYPDLFALLASGFKQDERVKDVLKLGMNGFLQKPYTIQELTKAVQSIVG